MCDGLYLILLKRFWSASSMSWVKLVAQFGQILGLSSSTIVGIIRNCQTSKLFKQRAVTNCIKCFTEVKCQYYNISHITNIIRVRFFLRHSVLLKLPGLSSNFTYYMLMHQSLLLLVAFCMLSVTTQQGGSHLICCYKQSFTLSQCGIQL